jgi:hypothetical protein
MLIEASSKAFLIAITRLSTFFFKQPFYQHVVYPSFLE